LIECSVAFLLRGLVKGRSFEGGIIFHEAGMSPGRGKKIVKKKPQREKDFSSRKKNTKRTTEEDFGGGGREGQAGEDGSLGKPIGKLWGGRSARHREKGSRLASRALPRGREDWEEGGS